MAMASSNPQTYMTQWLATATNGTVTGEFSLMHQRMRLKCWKCHATLTVPEPTDSTTVDYGVQEFVKLHSHKGGHGDEDKIGGGWTAYTADFKKIDLKPEKEAAIKAATDKTVTEINVLMNNDAAFAKKIASIQAGDKGKAPEKLGVTSPFYKPPKPQAWKTVEETQIDPNTGQLVKVNKVVEQPEWETEEEVKQYTKAIEKEISKQKAIENALKIKVLKQELEDLQRTTPTLHKSAPAPKPDAGGILKIATGRKFR